MTQKRIRELAEQALMRGNPYKKMATEFFIDREPRYIYAGEVMTAEEIDRAYLETASKDIKNGYDERMVGYYDKWYRYTRADEGRAYDMGCREAGKNPKCSEEFNIIPCAH